MASIAEGVAQILVDKGVGVLSGNGWTIKVSQYVSTPDQLITINDTGGAPPNPKWRLDFPTFQVQVRGAVNGYAAAWQKMKDCKDVLLGMDAQEVNGDRWDGVLAMGDLVPLGYDEQNRPMLAMNFRMFVEPAASALDNRESL
jgi:hypothetical protein